MYIDNLEVTIRFRMSKPGSAFIEREPDPTDGYLSQAPQGTFLIHAENHGPNVCFCLKVENDPATDSQLLTLFKGKKLIEKEDDPIELDIEFFQRRVPIFGWNKDRHPHTRSQQNKLVLLEWDIHARDVFTLYKFAIASWNGLHFFVHEKNEIRFYRDEAGKPVCPKFANWPGLVELLGYTLDADRLPPVAEYNPEPEITADGLPAGQARVLFYNPDKCWGTLTTPEGVARVHASSIVTDKRFARLQKGELVSYGLLVPAANEQTTHRQTKFELEAKEVRVLSEEKQKEASGANC